MTGDPSASTSMAATIDHAVINVRYDMDGAVERFRAFGFTLTERGYHSLGSINHLMMFDADYLELVGVPAGAERVRREIAEGPTGLNGLVFATGDAVRLHERLALQGVPVEPVLSFHRPVTLDGVEHRASFRTVHLAPGHLQGGRVYFCEHETRHLVWRPEWQRHRNGVHALAAVTVVVADPAREAARYAAIVGGTPRQVSGGESELAFGTCIVRFVTPAGYGTRYGAYACDAEGRNAFMGALALRTSALARVRECLAQAHEVTDVQRSPARITIAASLAYNSVIEFVE